MPLQLQDLPVEVRLTIVKLLSTAELKQLRRTSKSFYRASSLVLWEHVSLFALDNVNHRYAAAIAADRAFSRQPKSLKIRMLHFQACDLWLASMYAWRQQRCAFHLTPDTGMSSPGLLSIDAATHSLSDRTEDYRKKLDRSWSAYRAAIFAQDQLQNDIDRFLQGKTSRVSSNHANFSDIITGLPNIRSVNFEFALSVHCINESYLYSLIRPSLLRAPVHGPGIQPLAPRAPPPAPTSQAPDKPDPTSASLMMSRTPMGRTLVSSVSAANFLHFTLSSLSLSTDHNLKTLVLTSIPIATIMQLSTRMSCRTSTSLPRVRSLQDLTITIDRTTTNTQHIPAHAAEESAIQRFVTSLLVPSTRLRGLSISVERGRTTSLACLERFRIDWSQLSSLALSGFTYHQRGWINFLCSLPMLARLRMADLVIQAGRNHPADEDDDDEAPMSKAEEEELTVEQTEDLRPMWTHVLYALRKKGGLEACDLARCLIVTGRRVGWYVFWEKAAGKGAVQRYLEQWTCGRLLGPIAPGMGDDGWVDAVEVSARSV